MEHGTHSGYVNNQCRCTPCRAAHTAAVAGQRHRRYAARTLLEGRLVAPSYVEHGTVNTYTNWGCRCGVCTAAHTLAKRTARHARSGETP